MAVKIRLARGGRKKRAIYDVVVADARAPRDGRFIEKIGKYNPNTDPATIELDDEKAFNWVMKGAQPTDTVRAMLSYRGIMLKKHLQIGVNKGALTQEEADKKFEAWLAEKQGKIQAKRDKIAQDLESSTKARKDAEAKVKEARAEALRKKTQVETPEAAENTDAPAEEKEVVAETAPVSEEPAAKGDAEVKAETPAAEEAPAEAPAAEEAPAEAPVAEETSTEAPATEEAPAAKAEEKAPEAEAPKEEAPAKKEEEKKEE